MNPSEAHQLLDQAKAGHPHSKEAITQALWVTGDLRPFIRNKPVAQAPANDYASRTASRPRSTHWAHEAGYVLGKFSVQFIEDWQKAKA